MKCYICGGEGRFLEVEDAREGWICPNCGASSRHRAVMYMLGLCLGFRGIPVVAWEADKSLCILESSGYGFYPLLLKDKFDYYNTIFDPDSSLTRQPHTNRADLQQLAYPDGCLDAVIASDVFEHVREDDRAFKEICRVLKRSGFLIMTVPYHHDAEQTVTRVRIDGDRDVHLMAPEYHGGGEQTLTYRVYGRELLDKLRSVGFSVAYLEIEIAEYGIGKQHVFAAVKDSAIDLSRLHQATEMGGRQSVKASPLIMYRLSVFLKYNFKSVRAFASAFLKRLKDLG